jgi:hypothetical protein
VTAAQVLSTHLSDRDRFFGLGLAGPAKLAAHLSDDSGGGHVALGCFLHDRLVGVAGRAVAAAAARSRNPGGEPR